MNSDVEVLKEKSKIMEEAILYAMAFHAINGNVKDEISEHQAWKAYGKAWIIDRTERGWLHFSRSGATANSTKIYSRFEIECQKRSEKHIENAYQNAMRVCNEKCI